MKLEDINIVGWQVDDVQVHVWACHREIERLKALLAEIIEAADGPPIDYETSEGCGLYCGVEDHGCEDRYQGAEYGYAVGAESVLTWATSIAKKGVDDAPVS